MKCSCGGTYNIGPANRCDECGIAQPVRKKVILPIDDEPVIVKKTLCDNHDWNKIDHKLSDEGDKLYHEGRNLLIAKDAVGAAKKYAEAVKIYIRAKDGPAAGVANSFTLEYCKQILTYDKENGE